VIFVILGRFCRAAFSSSATSPWAPVCLLDDLLDDPGSAVL